MNTICNNCILLPAVGKQTQLFHIIFTELFLTYVVDGDFEGGDVEPVVAQHGVELVAARGAEVRRRGRHHDSSLFQMTKGTNVNSNLGKWS